MSSNYFWEEEARHSGWITLLDNGRIESPTHHSHRPRVEKWNRYGDTLVFDNGSHIFFWDEPTQQYIGSGKWPSYLKKEMVPHLLRKSKFVVGIPTLNRYDLLLSCVESVLNSSIPVECIYVIDNGGTCPWMYDVELVVPRTNLGVAGSWNLISKLAGDWDTIILNDDIQVGKDTIKKLLSLGTKVSCAANWSLFFQERGIWETIGPYDETYWPAYYEDADYRMRLRRAGIEVGHLYDQEVKHVGSATGDFRRSRENHQTFCNKWRL